MNFDAQYAPRHGKPEERSPEDVDPALTMPDDAIIGAHSDAEVVFVGPVGVGKTTAVRTLSTSKPIGSEVRASTMNDFVVGGKETTTVGIEMGVWNAPMATESHSTVPQVKIGSTPRGPLHSTLKLDLFL